MSNKPGSDPTPPSKYPTAPGVDPGGNTVQSTVFAVGDRPADPTIMLQISGDGGRTWEPSVTESLGAIGEYRTRVRWHRLGSGESLVLRFAISDPVPMAALDLQIEAEGAAA